MKTTLLSTSLLLTALTAFAVEPALTIYNQNFAVVRDTVPLDLKSGVTDVNFSNTTAHLEPDSVILRDPSGKVKLQILEQNYRNDPVSQELLLSLFEGKTIDFVIRNGDQPDRTVQGKIIRSGYMVHSQQAMQRYGQRYAQSQMDYGGNNGRSQPIIEVDGKLQFTLPGQPIFPSLGDDTILKPMLAWKLESSKPGKLDAELSYITGGMSWEADYNVVAPEDSDILDIIGWVTMDNQSGRNFENAHIKLMAGEVNKIQPNGMAADVLVSSGMRRSSMSVSEPGVTEKAFDEYHLYTLVRPATLHDHETKQVEFIRASGVKSEKIYVYDGLRIDWNRWRGNGLSNLRRNDEFGSESDTKIAVMREFKNSEANHLGMPLPKGRVRFYKQDGKQIEFTGENVIDHTPKDETIRIYTGNAFDITGERRRTDLKIDNSDKWVDESIEIKLRNHKKETVEVRVVEHLYRWTNWELVEKSNTFLKLNAQQIEFRIQLKPDEEKVLTYKVHYSW
ncbi:MAG: hypothetical protein ABI615_06950 [Chthoniobacterales bacterium]